MNASQALVNSGKKIPKNTNIIVATAKTPVAAMSGMINLLRFIFGRIGVFLRTRKSSTLIPYKFANSDKTKISGILSALSHLETDLSE